MKMIKTLVVLLAVTSPWTVSRDVAAADVSVGFEVSSVNDFYEPLAAQGYWVEVGSYGRCWHPYYVEATWRPYCSGTWVWTDVGWYWQSDEPWGWACYHYGRWAYDSYYGWVWVPDVEWGPSWVVFRQGGGYCGWAPLPPGWRGGVVVSAEIAPANWFVFVGEHHFGERVRARDVIVNNTIIINRTTVINRTETTANNRVIAAGPRIQDVQRVSRARIQTSTVQALRQHEKVPPAVHRAAPQQPAIQPQNQRQNERPVPAPAERQRPPNNPPEVIRGAPNAPPQQPERRETPPPAEHKEPGQQHPSGPPPGEQAAPPPPHQKAPPPQEEKREKGPPPHQDSGEGHGHDRHEQPGEEGRGHGQGRGD